MKQPLGRLIGQEKNLQFLKGIANKVPSLAVIDSAGKALFGSTPTDQVDRYAINLDGEEIGWVQGDELAGLVATMLTRLLEDLVNQEALGKEALNSYKELNLFYSLPERFRACTTFEEISHITLTEICNHLKAIQASIMVMDEDKHALRVVASKGRLSKRRVELKMGEGIAGKVLGSGEPMLVTEVEQDDPIVDNHFSIRSLICVPIKVGGHSVGIVNVSSREDGDFSAQDLKLATALTLQAGWALENAILQHKRVEQDRMQRYLERHISAEATQRVLKEGEEIFNPCRRTISYVCTELCGSLGHFDSMPAEEVVACLNSYFSRMTDILFKHGATLDRIADRKVIAYFNAPMSCKAPEKRAVEMAITLQEMVREYPDPWFREHFQLKIGIHSGSAVMGALGMVGTADYSATGPAVEVSHLLLESSKGGEIVVSEAIHQATSQEFAFQPLDKIPPTGQGEPIERYAVVAQ